MGKEKEPMNQAWKEWYNEIGKGRRKNELKMERRINGEMLKVKGKIESKAERRINGERVKGNGEN